MTQPAIQSLWVGERLSPMERLSISSFLKNGHEYHLYVYGRPDGVPDGAVLKDANDVIPESEIFVYREHASVAGFSDVFRYKLLFEKGGYWADTDLVCLRHFEFGDDHVFAQERTRLTPVHWLTRTFNITSWLIKAPPGSAMMQFCYQAASSRDRETLLWGQIGPRLMHHAVQRFSLRENALPWAAFFPIEARQWKQFIDGSAAAARKWEQAGDSAFGMHLYNEMWRRNGAEKDAVYPSNCIYEQLKARYLD